MASFIGRSGHYLLFEDQSNAVIVDTRVSVVVAAGAFTDLKASSPWGSGEFSEADQAIAELALSDMLEPTPVPTGRLYTIPLGAQRAAQEALNELEDRGIMASAGATAFGKTLAQGGQIDFNQLAHMANYFERHEGGTPDVPWNLHGGNAAKKWSSNIVSRESVDPTPDAAIDAKTLMESESGPEFLARVALNGEGIDRLYRLDTDGRTYVWEDNTWNNFGHPDWDVWRFDRLLDGPSAKSSDSTHVEIDPESAIHIAANLRFGNVYVEDINPAEANMVKDAISDLDWELLDSAIVAVGTPGDGVYTEDERSENASQQVRDKNGKFAKQGGRVMVNGVPGATGIITRVNPANKTVEISMDNGGSQIVPANQVESVGQYTTTIPGKPVEVPRVDFSGILAEPRTPANRVQGQIPGTLPAMTSADLHAVINNFPAWVKAQRASFQEVASPAGVHVQGKNSLSKGAEGRRLEEETGLKLTTDAYDHPLLNEWLNRRNRKGKYENKLWYDPITAAGEVVEEVEEAADTNTESPVKASPESGEVTPETSDVQPVYMAVVSPDDPRAVFKLISLVPSSAKTLSPMVYSREDGQWVRDEQTLNDLRSATPPPVVPLDSDALNDTLQQVDGSQSENKGPEQVTPEDEQALQAPLPTPENLPPGAPAPQDVVVASADFDLMVLWGPRKDVMQAALVAAGGADRNRGGAEKLRRYWTKGPGAAKIGWGTPGDWTRCVRHLGKYLGPRAKGYCALRHKEMTGMWTGDKKHRQVFSANLANNDYSTLHVESTHQILQAAVLRGTVNSIHDRINKGIVAAGAAELAPTLPIYDTPEKAVEAITAAGALPTMNVGGAFWMPLALPEGIESGDGRLVEEGVAEIRNLPISLLWQFKTASGHDGSVVVGRIERLHRVPGGIGAGYGHFDTGPWGREAERMVRNGMLRFVSADMDKFGAMKEKADDGSEAAADPDMIESDKITVKKARVMAVTIVAKPAFQEATIQIVPDQLPEEEDVFPDGLFAEEPDPVDAPALIAAGYIAESIPVVPPATWFGNPKLDRATPLTVTDDGRVFGHVAAWATGHINPRLNGINPPRSKSNYAYFHSGVLRTDDGNDIPVGQLTLSGGHAGLEFSAREAVKHYDDTGSAVADVHAGEDEFGIWVAGSLRPGVSPEQVRAFRASAPSGDWRPIRGHLELVAVCQVNVPGFPIARAFVASGEMTALVAAGASTLVKMKSDPIAELNARIEALEFHNGISNDALAERVASLMARVQPSIDAQQQALQNRAEAVFATMENFGYIPKKTRDQVAEKAKRKSVGSASLTASVESMRSRVSEFASKVDADELERLRRERGAVGEADPKVQAPETVEDGRPKYKPGHQPRDYNGQFRDVLARLKENLGTSGNQGIVNKIKETDAKVQTGDYVTAVRGALDLRENLDRLDNGSLDKEAIGSVRETAKNLGTVIANLPLPFDNQAEKVRFSDLPPTLRDLMHEFVERVEKKIGKEDAKDVVQPVKSFMSGSDVFSQSDISRVMSKLLRLLT